MRILNYNPQNYRSSVHFDFSITSSFVDGVEVISFKKTQPPKQVSADLFSLSSMLEAGIDLSKSHIGTDTSNRFDDLNALEDLPIDDIINAEN